MYFALLNNNNSPTGEDFMKLKLVTGILMVAVLSASADFVYSFKNVSANSVADAAIGEAQLSFTVSKPNDDQVLFTFNNAGPEASSICDIYFDDDAASLTFIEFQYPTDGVVFTVGAKPKDLPSGGSFSSNYSYDSDNPTQPNGINPNESLGILFTLAAGTDFNSIISSLNSGAIQVGIHVQGFASDGSESFVNKVPEPASVSFLAIGFLSLLGAGFFSSRRKK
jgi:hypothetical protein